MKNKVILITAAASGGVESDARKFAGAGVKVVVSGRRKSERNAVVDGMNSADGESSFLTGESIKVDGGFTAP